MRFWIFANNWINSGWTHTCKLVRLEIWLLSESTASFTEDCNFDWPSANAHRLSSSGPYFGTLSWFTAANKTVFNFELQSRKLKMPSMSSTSASCTSLVVDFRLSAFNGQSKKCPKTMTVIAASTSGPWRSAARLISMLKLDHEDEQSDLKIDTIWHPQPVYRSRRSGVTWSYLLTARISRTVAFRTYWSLFNSRPGRPARVALP